VCYTTIPSKIGKIVKMSENFKNLHPRAGGRTRGRGRTRADL